VTRLLAATLVPLAAWTLVSGFVLREGDDNFDLMSQKNTVLAADVPITPDPADATPGVFYGPESLSGVEPAAGLGPSVYSGLAIGVPSYRADADTPVIDLLGLGEPVVSHFRLEQRGDLAGHEKTMPVWWFLARATAPGSEELVDPDLETAEPFYTGDYGSEPAGTLAERTALTRAALRCEPVADLIDAAEAPMSGGRFVENLLGAPARTLRRIPANPEELLDFSGGLPQCRAAG
jgi:arabinofuranosyltransferase